MDNSVSGPCHPNACQWAGFDGVCHAPKTVPCSVDEDGNVSNPIVVVDFTEADVYAAAWGEGYSRGHQKMTPREEAMQKAFPKVWEEAYWEGYYGG